MKSLAELTKNIGQLLNERCKSRFHRLTLSQADWGGENEKPMDIASANLFVDFITQYTKTYTIDADDLSIFLNYDGCIVTSWSAKNTADTIDLFFMEKEIEVCSNQFEFTSEINEELFQKISNY